MPVKYISDDEVTLCLQGLRWVAKRDWAQGGHFDLMWSYKNDQQAHTYKSEKDRDAIFKRVSEALEGEG